MKLHLPKSLRTALLSCLAAISPWSLTLATGAISVGAVAFVLASSDALAATTTYSSSTETYNGETYAGHVFTLDLSYSGWDGDGGDGSYTTTWDACNVRFANRADTKLMYYTYSTNEAGEEVKTENYVSTDATGGPDNQKIWYSFLGTNTQYSTKAGNTLRLTGATQNTVIGFDYEPISLGGLIVDACLGGHTYKLMGASGSGGASARDMELKAGEGLYANMTIGANTSIELGSDTFTVASGGAWNVADDINLIIKAGTAQLQAGVQVTLKGLGNLDLGTTALKMADGASMVVAEGATLTLGANASGSTGAITNNGSVYLEGRGSTFALTNNATGTVYLTGANSVATLNNDGTLSFAEGSTLTLGSMANDFYGGKTYSVGNLALTSGGAVSNWAPYFGYTDGTEMTYQDGQLTVTVDGSGYYWNGTEDSYSWSAANLLKGGNAATIAAGGRLYLTADAAYKTVNMDTTVALGDIYLQSDGYTLNVTADNSIPTNFVVGASSYTLTKTGAATLTMSSAQIGKLAGITVNEGDLLVSDRIAVGKPITVNEGGTVVFGGTTGNSVNTTVNGNGRVEVAFVTSGNHSRHAKLGADFSGTLALSGLFELTACQVGSSASYEFAAGEFWTSGGTVSNNISVVGDSADAFRMRSGGTLILSGVVTGNYSVGHSDNRGTIILSNINSGSGTVDLDYGTLQLGNNNIAEASKGLFSDMVVNVGTGATLKLHLNDKHGYKSEGASTVDTVINIKGDASMVFHNGATHVKNAIAVDSGKTLTLVNQWNKNHFLAGITGDNIKVVVEEQAYGDHPYGMMVVLTGESESSFSGTLELKNKKSAYSRGVAAQKSDILKNVVVDFTSNDNGAVLLFTNSQLEMSNNYDITSATRENGAVAGLSGTKGKVYAAGLTINTAADTSYTYGGELNITSLTKSGAGSQSLTQGLNLSGALTVEGGSLTLAGIVSVGSIANSGLIDVAGVTSLSVADMDTSIGSSYEIGNITGYDTIGWNALLGVEDSIRIGYSDGQLIFAHAGQSVVWQGGTGATWDTTGAGDLVTDSWHDGGDGVYVPDATSAIVLGNAETLTNAGIDSAAVSREIVIDADVTSYSLTVQDAYSLSVAEGETYSFDAGSIVLAEGGSLSKVGAGTLSMSLEDAVTAQMNIDKGTLSISGTLADTSPSEVSPIDMSALGGEGTLSITAAGVNGGTSDGTRTNVVLGNGFTGTLQVSGGQLDADSTTGGASLVVLDGATLTDTHGDGVHTVAWNIKVSDNDAYLRHFGYAGQDNRDSYATRLTGTLTGSADAMLKVIDSGEWFLAGDMSGYQGGLSIEGDTNYVTFESSATLASLTAADGSRIMVDKGATLNTATTAVSGTVTTGATEGATLNLGAVTIAKDGTLKIEGAGTHTLSTLAMVDNSTLELATGTSATITDSAHHAIGNGKAATITLGAGATLTDAGSWQLTGSTMTVQGGGEYKLNSLVLSANQAYPTTVNVESGTTLHITGTATNGSTQAASFGLGHWNANNAVNVRGVLELECGISSYSGYSNTATITVENGGKIAFNNGLHAAGKDNAGVINIKGGGVLEVSGTNVTGTNLVTVDVKQDGIVMGGNANGSTESKIANNLNFGGGAYIGAKKGTTLTIAPEDGSTNLNWLDVLGTGSDTDTVGRAQGAGGKVVFDSAVTVVWNVKVHAGAEADFNNALTMTGTQDGNGLYNYGTLTVDGVYSGKAFTNAAGAEATFNSGISLMESVGTAAVVDNSGNLTVTGTTAMSRFNNKTGAEATFNSGLSLFESAGTAAVVDNSGKLTVNGTLSMYHFNNNVGAEAEINGDVISSNGNYALIYNSGKVSFNANVEEMHQIRNSEGGEMVFTGEMNGSVDALQNAGKLVFDGATVRLGNAILNGGTVEILNAADTQFVLSNGLMQEIVGVSKTWTLVNNTGVGTITGWDALGLGNFLLDGSALQKGDWDGVRITDGKVMLYMLTRYWDATGEDGVWNTGADANWREFEDATETVTFEANSRVTFTETDETGAALDKSVTVADAGVQAKNVAIAGTGYEFSGGKVLVNESLSAQQNARFDSAVVIGSSAPLQLDVAAGATLTLSTLETVSTQSYGGVSYGSGAFSKTGEGTLLITDAINGTITGATVSGGKLALGSGVNLAVGANTVTGGSLGNVELLSSGTVTDYTGATAQANNVIKSAVGENYAMLTNVALHAGAATGYASLQKVAFAGNSTLSGYITYESTKQQRQMAVATGGKLTVSNLTFDLHGLSAGTKVLIENGAVADAAEGFTGKLLGWNSDNVTLLYSGIAVNSAAVNMNTAGVVELSTEDKEASRLYWDGLVAGAAEGDDPVASSAWDKSSANWSTADGTDGISAFLALSNTYFGATPERGSKTVNAAQDMVMSNMFVTAGNYRFTGSRLATLGNMYITPESGAVSFANDLVAQGNVELRAAQDGSVTLGGALQAGGTITANVAGALSFDNAVSAGGKVELNAQNLEVNGALLSAGDVSISSGTKTAGGAGSLTIGESGSITGANVTINVNAGAESDTHYRDYVVESAGAITATAEGGKVSFTGNGAAHITGTVTADEIVVDTQSSNGIIFRQLDTDTLTITEGSYAALTDETSTGQQETSRIGTIQLGGRLGLTQFAGTYSGYNLVTTSATATVDFATIAKVTFASVKGEQLADGTYGSIVFNDSYRELTVNKLETVNNITFGAGEYWAKLNNASGAIHGNLTVRGGGGLYVSSDDIMANGKGAWYIGGPLYLQGTTQTLAGNAVYLDGAVISGTHASGMNYTAHSQIHYTGNNTISANMTVADGKVLTIEAGNVPEDIQAEQADILTLNGNLNGNGDVLLTGSGRVSLGAANAFTGTMTVQNHTQLSLDNTQALASANLVLNPNGVLIVDRSAVETPFTIGALTLGGGALQINNLMAMDAVSAQDAALKLGKLQNLMTNTLYLTLSFTSGELQTMKTYNLFTADATYSLADIAKLLNLNLSVVNGTETLPIADNQYKLVYDADSNVIAIRTMLGNIWDGGADGDGDGIWSTDNTHKNWSDSDYDQATAFNDAIFADLTGEGIGENAVVTIQGTVNPGDVYFEADTTDYVLNATDTGAMLGAGNVIHKAGAADVTLNLANNGTVETALGGMDLQAGNTTLAANVAVKGEVSVAAGATLQTGANTLLMVGGNGEAYTAQGTYSGVTMDATGIAGVADALGVVTNGIIDGAAELNYLNLTGTGKLTDVTIGSGVNVAAGSAYTLNGHITFLDTLQNAGTVNFAEGVTVELGALSSNLSADGTSYIYQLVQGDGTINGLASGTTEQDSGITASDVFINGVNLSAGLADGIATVLSSDNGTVSISIGKKLEGGGVDGSIAVPVWDARWGDASEQPSLAKRYNDAAQTGKVFFSGDAGYQYGNIVNAENAAKVNGGSAIVVNLAAGAFATASHNEFVAGASGETYAGYETWIYDQSDVYQVVAGQYAADAQSFAQTADTHLLVDAQNTESKGWVVGGSWTVGQQADSYVTVKNGLITNLVGAGVFSAQTCTAHVYVDGGTVTNIYGAGYGNGASLTADASKNPNAVEMLLTGGTLTTVYGGSVDVTGNIAVTVEGNANITTLYGGSMNGGEVTGNINLDLISGSITTVHAAGASGSTLTGNVTVTLHNDDVVTGALYGGKETTNEQTTNKVNGDYTSTLSFAEANTTYDMTGITVQGFDTFSLADGSYVKVTTDGSRFGTDTASDVLTISGAGKVELVGGTDLGRNITLTNGATLWFNSDKAGNDIGNAGQNSTAPAETRYLLTATAGTTIEITGRPTKDGDGLCVWLDLAGHGAEGKGALYKALNGAETTPSGKVALPKVTLSDSASVNAEDNIYFIEWKNVVSELKLEGNTLTKVGEADLVLYNSTVTDTSANDTDAGVDGTIFVKEGTLGTGYGMRAAKTNVVLSSGSLLDITSAGTESTNIGALSGSGSVSLSNGLVITTSSAGSYGKGSDWMTEGADAFSQFSADSGFAYGVYSGTISGSNSLSVKGDAVQYLSGSDSTFSGGVHMYDSATLYLMSGTSGSAVQGNSTVTAGVVGTGAIAWDSPDAKLYLGNGVQVYNAGTTNVANSNMIIGVEAAPHGDALSNYVGVNSKGADGVLYITVGGKEYVEIDTHNLQSITCDGMYADGTAYVAGTEIDRNKMLLVEKSVWELNTATVAGFSAGGYNTATYSGVLSGNANLVKVGLGTLILDQTNTYTGKTIISQGSLVLKGWAQIGGSADSAALNVTQTAGSTLMLAYDGTYGNEIEGISNDMSINGTGDVRWKTEAATNKATAALISSVSGQTPFTLSGDISGGGNLLHCGSGTLVLSGDSSFTGGTHATRGVVEVQSATGLGAGVVNIESTADLHVTVEEGTTDSRVTTTLAAADTKVQGDVVISGTESTERILNVATGGYNNSSTTLHDNGTLLVNGAGVAASTGTLSGTGTVAVSDATGTGAKVDVHQMTAYTGDFVVEGNNASITVENGSYSGGSISVSGNDAVLSTKGDITITNGESLSLSSRGNAGAENDAAYVTTTGSVSVASGATLSVSDAATSYEYNLQNLQNLQAAASLNGVHDLVSGATTQTLVDIANIQNTEHVYKGAFDTTVAMNQKAAGAVKADGGLTLAAGATYETAMANTSLLGGSLTLESGLTLSTTLDLGPGAIDGAGRTTQLVLFSDVNSVNFVLDNLNAVADADGGIYYTKAENYITGNYIDENTWLVYDSGAGVVYLDGIVPEPTTATLSLLALAALAARRRRR